MRERRSKATSVSPHLCSSVPQLWLNLNLPHRCKSVPHLWLIFLRELLRHVREPAVAGQRVRAELFADALLFAVEQRAVLAQLVAERRVDEVARIGGGHLE